MKNINFIQILESLTSTNEQSPLNGKCNAKILDTIFYEEKSAQLLWFFTNKSGVITRKKRESAVVNHIADRFEKFALSNPFNEEKFIGVLVNKDQQYHNKSESEFKEYIDSNSLEEMFNQLSFMQVYLHPCKGLKRKFHINSNVKENDTLSSTFFVSENGKILNEETISGSVMNQMSQVINDVLQCLRQRGILISEIELQFIVDDNEHAWLSNITRCSLYNTNVTSPSKENGTSESPTVQQSPVGIETIQEIKMKPSSSGKTKNPEAKMKQTGSTPSFPSYQAQIEEASLNSNHSRPTGKLVSKKDLLKEHKRKKGEGLNATKPSPIDEPPNMEMLAKFAAERERQKALLEEADEHDEEESWVIENHKNQKKQYENPSNNSSTNKNPKTKKPVTKKPSTTSKNKNLKGSSEHGSLSQFRLPAVNATPPTEEEFTAAEKRITELQKLADTTATIKAYVKQQKQQQHQQPKPVDLRERIPLGSHSAGSTNGRPNGGPNTAISGPEADFLVRQIHSATKVEGSGGNLDQGERLALLQQLEELSTNGLGLEGGSLSTLSPGGSVKSMGKRSHMGESVVVSREGKRQNERVLEGEKVNGRNGRISDVLNERIAGLQEQVEALKGIIRGKEEELEKKDEKVRKLKLQVENIKQESKQQISQLEEEHKKHVLRLENYHTKEKESLTGDAAKRALANPSKGPQNSKDTNSGAFFANNKLIEQLEVLRNEQRKQHEQFNAEKATWHEETRNKILVAEGRLQQELIEERRKKLFLEDQVATTFEKLRSIQSQMKTMEKTHQQLENSKQNAVEEASKLRADLRLMQQSVQANYRFDTTQANSFMNDNNSVGGNSTVTALSGVTNGADAATVIRLNDAKNEAKVRQLMNKLEFLKAQLETEKRAVDDAKITVNMSQQKLEDLKMDCDMRLQEAENEKIRLVQETEERLQLQYENRMVELTSLQSKVLAIQGQLQEYHDENIQIKQKEENSKNNLTRSMVVQQQQKTEIDMLKKQLLQMKEVKQQEMLEDSKKVNLESTIRRLDNEREYLKKQLSSEITHKNELQGALTRNQQQLQEVQQQWQTDVDALKETVAECRMQLQLQGDKYDQMELQLQSELNEAQQQTQELRNGFLKMRDQVRMEQLTVESVNTQRRRLDEGLTEAREEVKRLQEQEDLNNKLHAQQVEAIQATMQQQQDFYKKELGRLNKELSSQYRVNSENQRNMMNLQEEFSNEKKEITRNQKISNLVNRLEIWKNVHLRARFHQLKKNTMLLTVANQFKRQVEGMLKDATNQLNKDKLLALEQQNQKLQNQFSNEKQKLQNQFDEQLQTELKTAENNKILALQNQQDEHNLFVENLKTAHEEHVQKLRDEGDEAVKQTIERKNKEIEQHERSHKLTLEHALSDAKERQEQSLAEQKIELEGYFDQVMEDTLKDMTNLRDKMLSDAAVEHDFQLNSLQKKMEEKIANLRTNHSLEVQQIKDEAMKRLGEEKEKWTEEKEVELIELEQKVRSEENENQRKMREELYEMNEGRIRKLREEWELEWEKEIEKKKVEFNQLLEDKMDEYAQIKEAEKVRAIKLESNKWLQKLKDNEKSNELENKKSAASWEVAKEKLLKVEEERTLNRLQHQQQQLEMENKIKTQQLENDHMKLIQELNKEHENKLENQKNTLTEELTEKHALEWTNKMNERVNQVEIEYKQKLENINNSLDQVKKDFTTATLNYTEERKKFQMALNNCDDRKLQMEELHKQELETLKLNHEKEKEIWEEEKELDKIKHSEEIKREKEKLTEELNIQFKIETNRIVDEEKEKLKAEMEGLISLQQKANDDVINSLKDNIEKLEKNKDLLTNDIKEMNEKMNKMQDTIFNLEENNKLLLQNKSLLIWKTATNSYLQKIKHEKNMNELTKEMDETMKNMKIEMQEKIDNYILLVLKLAIIVQENENTRVKNEDVLKKLHSKELLDRRRQIQTMEKKLEQLGFEKEALDEEKDGLETDLNNLELQVKDLEDEIRKHNQESSMINGRVNVVHARKKRRLDSELEDVLEKIEAKRVAIVKLDEYSLKKANDRDDLEMMMMEIEREVVQLLFEQQKLILKNLEMAKVLEERGRSLLGLARIPWVLETEVEPTLENVSEIHKKWKEDEEKRLDTLNNK